MEEHKYVLTSEPINDAEDSNGIEEDKSILLTSEPINDAEDSNDGWQTVTYAKKRRKNQNKEAAVDPSHALANGTGSSFKGLEKHERAAALLSDDGEIPVKSDNDRRGDDDDDDDNNSSRNGDAHGSGVGVNKKKKKKVKKPKVTVADAASKIDADDLAAFLSSLSELNEGQQDQQMMKLADYFGRAFSAVNASQFPWLKLFRESSVANIADIPVSYISEAVYKISVDWINHQSDDSLESFVAWSLDSIFADLASLQLRSKGSKNGVQPATSESQVAIFLTLAMVLRRKPDVLVNLFPKLRENTKYKGQEKLLVLVWMILQASQGDLPVGLQLWSCHILPMLSGKLGSSNPQTRDLILHILVTPKARNVLVSNAIRKGERLVPPTALDLLLHFTFPPSSRRTKVTERFEEIYPLLKEVALAGTPGSKSMKQVSLQIQDVAVKAAREGIPALQEEATNIFIWCLAQNPDCYKQWDEMYMDNIKASVAALRKLSENWDEYSSKLLSLQALKDTLKSFRKKNASAISGELHNSQHSLFKEADNYCKAMLGRLSSSHGWLKATVLSAVVFAVTAAVLSPNIGTFDWDKFNHLFNP
ncbi:uncharacterized protein LOC127261012 [Andrographis paniculata]|uniref:uncharacterized protein LOC127261012 n=1 Tax=Andrographis paniculata TaxID=175694 RepID=UPI0021E809F7|nr:uncharacterized protein LOC127261012 [Andrographis paniculata]